MGHVEAFYYPKGGHLNRDCQRGWRNSLRYCRTHYPKESPQWEAALIDLINILKWFKGTAYGDGYVYFIRRRDELIKIGYSIYPDTRKEILGRSYGPLETLGLIKAVPEIEKALHLLFREYRVEGEWFTPCPKLLDFIAKHSEVIE